MKQNLVAFLAGISVLSGIGVSSAGAQVPNRKDSINWIADVPFRISSEIGSDMGNEPVEHGLVDHERDPAVETRNLQAEFRGTNLTADQFEQIRQARRQFRAELQQVMTEDLGDVLLLVFLPPVQAEQQAGKVLGHSIANYSQSVTRILTPAQLQIWQQNLEQGAQRRLP